jgi:hypothetical protein
VDIDTTQFIESFCSAFVGKSEIEGGFALEDHVERGCLDFTINSLHYLDDYLLDIHRNDAELSVQAYVNSLMGCAFYLGEVIRRMTATTRRFEWVAAVERDMNDEATSITGWTHIHELATLVSARGQFEMPGRVIARILRRGAKAQSCRVYAMKVIGVTAV